MSRSERGRTEVVWAALVLCSSAAAMAAAPARARATSSGQARVIVTVTGAHHAPPATLHRDDVLVYENGQRRPVISWEPLRSGRSGLDFAILIDDSLGSSVGLQFPDIRSFIHSLPAGSRAALAYGRYGSAVFAAQFTKDRENVIRALRLPTGSVSLGSSIYMALDSLIRHWPQDGAPREVLLITSGIDLYRGIEESEPTEANLDLMQAMGAAQRHSVTVHTIYGQSAGFEGRNYFLINNGQGSLARLAFETGGAAFQDGFQSPVSFAPYLHQLTSLLNHQFLLTFRLTPSGPPGFQPLRVTTEVPGANLAAPDRVFVSATH